MLGQKLEKNLELVSKDTNSKKISIKDRFPEL